LEKELLELEKSEIQELNKYRRKKKRNYQILNKRISKVYSSVRFINNNKNNSETYILTIQERLKQIEEELYQNKQHLKLKNLGADEQIKVAIEQCPTCGQNINDTLLPEDSIETSMSITENIGYLSSQKSMAETFINRHKKDLERKFK
jgi:predicted  nucleic acid-binding Zn-ribbon protein